MWSHPQHLTPVVTAVITFNTNNIVWHDNPIFLFNVLPWNAHVWYSILTCNSFLSTAFLKLGVDWMRMKKSNLEGSAATICYKMKHYHSNNDHILSGFTRMRIDHFIGLTKYRMNWETQLYTLQILSTIYGKTDHVLHISSVLSYHSC